MSKELKNLYKSSIDKFETIYDLIKGGNPKSFIIDEIYQQCSFCFDAFENNFSEAFNQCDVCRCPREICANGGHDGLLGKINSKHNTRDSVSKIVMKIINNLNDELRRLEEDEREE